METFRKLTSISLLLIHLWTAGECADLHDVLLWGTSNRHAVAMLSDHSDAAHCKHTPVDYSKECVLCPLCSSSVFFSTTNNSFTQVNSSRIVLLNDRSLLPKITSFRACLHRGPPVSLS